MRKISTFALALLAAVSCQFVSFTGEAASTSKSKALRGPVVVDTLDLKDFNAIVVNGSADVKFMQSDEFLVELTANEGVLEELDCRVEDGSLILAFQHLKKVRAEHFNFLIKAPQLNAITVNGAADLDILNYASDAKLELEVNGAGDLDVKNVLVPALTIELNGAGDITVADLETEYLSVEVNGAGDAVLSGHAAEASIRISGAGDIDARKLKMDKYEQSKHGVGRIRL